MQPQLRPPDELSPPEDKSDRCAIWGCINKRLPDKDHCISHTTPPAQQTCPDCHRYGRGPGAVFMASGVAVCGACGWGRNRVPKAKRKAGAGRRK